MDFNKVIITGRIAGTPKVTPQKVDAASKEITSPTRTSFTVIVNRFWKKGKKDAKDDRDAFPCVMFGPAGEKIAQYLTVGKTVTVEGRGSFYDIGAVTPDGRKQRGFCINVGPFGVYYGPDSQKVRGPQQVEANNAALAAVVKALADKGIDVSAALNPKKEEAPPAQAAGAAATGPEVDLPFGDEGIEG